MIAETKLNDFLIINVQWCNKYIILKFYSLLETEDTELKDKSDMYQDVYIPYVIEIALIIWLVNIQLSIVNNRNSVIHFYSLNDYYRWYDDYAYFCSIIGTCRVYK